MARKQTSTRSTSQRNAKSPQRKPMASRRSSDSRSTGQGRMNQDRVEDYGEVEAPRRARQSRA